MGASRAESIRLGIAAGEKSVSIDPKNADAFYALGFLYSSSGDIPKSQELMRQCLALNRNHAPAYFYYGQKSDPARTARARPFPGSSAPLRSVRAIRWDSVWHGAIARARNQRRDDERAIEAARKGIAANREPRPQLCRLGSPPRRILGAWTRRRRRSVEFFPSRSGRAITGSRYRTNLTSDVQPGIKA
jgi:tetratricopeptide (TPR) repeat protein